MANHADEPEIFRKLSISGMLSCWVSLFIQDMEKPLNWTIKPTLVEVSGSIHSKSLISFTIRSQERRKFILSESPTTTYDFHH